MQATQPKRIQSVYPCQNPCRARPNNTKSPEVPLIQQLKSMDWTWLNDQDGDIYVPGLTERENFRQVLLVGRLRQAIHRINLAENGQPWLDEVQINETVSALERLGTSQPQPSQFAPAYPLTFLRISKIFKIY